MVVGYFLTTTATTSTTLSQKELIAKEGLSGRIEDKKENKRNVKRHVPVVLM